MKQLKFIIPSVFVLLLSGCSWGSHHAPVTSANAVTGTSTNSTAVAQGAQTQGIGSTNGFNGQNVAQNAQQQTTASGADQIYYFDFDRAGVSQDDDDSLKVQANYLIAHSGARIRLEGNTDPRGSREYNVALGWRRAKAVARVLEQYGVPRKQLTLVSYGQEKLAIPGGYSEHDYQLDRRVNLLYTTH